MRRSAVAAAFLAVVLAGCGAPPPSVAVEQVDRQQDGTFALEIRTAKDRYKASDAIPILTNLMFLGPEPRRTVTGSSTLVTFGLEQIDGPLDMGGGADSICAHYELTARQPISVPYVKSGGWSNDDPLAGFWRSYFSDKELHLPAGSWRITASLDAIAGQDCQGHRHQLAATVAFVVEN